MRLLQVPSYLHRVQPCCASGGVLLRSLTEGFDTSTASGRLLYHVLGAVAEFEREVINERTVAGMKAAKKRGTHVGRPQALVGSRPAEAGRVLAAGSRKSRPPVFCGCPGRRSNGPTPGAAAGAEANAAREVRRAVAGTLRDKRGPFCLAWKSSRRWSCIGRDDETRLSLTD